MTTHPMKVTAIAPWLGSKRTMAPVIIAQLGTHAAYHEPFCGGLSILLAKPACQQETVNDLHGDLTNLARVLRHRQCAEHLYDRLARTLFCEAILEEARAWLRSAGEVPPDREDACSPLSTDHAIERAYWWFIQAWAGRNGVAGSLRDSWQICVRWTPSGGSASTRWVNAIDSIPAWHERLRNVVILRHDAFGIIEKIPRDNPRIAMYLDPPYTMHTRSGDNNGGYRHDFTDHGPGGLMPDDHSRLASALTEFAPYYACADGKPVTRVVLSYYADPRLEALYPPEKGWTHIDHARHKHLAVQNKRGAKRTEAPEILIVNGPEFGAEAAP